MNDAISNEYRMAYEKSAKAIADFKLVTQNYRKRLIGDEEYLAARAVYQAALAEYDLAYGSEWTKVADGLVREQRIAAIPAWYWERYPETRQRVLDGDNDLLDYIEDKIEDWRTDPLE